MSTKEGFCTQPFDPNPDVSGLGMLIAFYVQGILNFSVGIVHYILLPIFPAHEPLRKWTGVLLLDLVNNWVAVGIALIIAAFSQWKTISIFHLYICSNLAFTIPIFNPTAVGVIDPHSNRSMLQVAYFILYGMLRLALSAYLIYRFRYWENTSGRCFAVSHAGPVHIGMETRTKLIALTACYIALDLSLATLGLIRQIRRGRAVLDFTKGLVHPAWTQKKYTAVMRGGLYLGLFTGNIISTITLVHANRGHVLGDEYMFTFGQVGALVVLAGSFYAMVNSFLQYREQQKHSSTGDLESPKVDKPSEDPRAIPPDENTPLPGNVDQTS